MHKLNTKRICLNAIMLALLCSLGMISIPLGENIKVSLQLLVVFIIALTANSFIDPLIVTSLYLCLGMVLPIYAGLNNGITPTFGFVISFVVISPIIYFLNKVKIKNSILRMSFACLVGTLICYIIGTLFLMFYLDISFISALLIATIPYIPFDILKIVIAVLVVKFIPEKIYRV